MTRLAHLRTFVLTITLVASLAWTESIAPQTNFQAVSANALSAFTHQYDGTDFGKVIRLGGDKMVPYLAHMEVVIDPTMSKPGWFRVHVLSGVPYMTIQSTNFTSFYSSLTLWHETIHALVHAAGGAPCPEDEAYAYLSEARIDWLNKLKKFETSYNAKQLTNKVLRANWDALAAEWNNANKFKKTYPEIGGPAVQNLSGPFWSQDADNTCKEGTGKWTKVDAAYVSKWDSILGIDINLAKIRAVYKRLDLPDLNSGKLLVRVMDTEGNRLPRASVTVTGGNLNLQKVAGTEGAEFDVPVSPGNPNILTTYIHYQVRASLPGYQTATEANVTVFPDPSPPRDVLIRLTPMPAPNVSIGGTWTLTTGCEYQGGYKPNVNHKPDGTMVLTGQAAGPYAGKITGPANR